MNQPSGSIIQIGAVTANLYTGEILEKLSVIINPRERISPYITNLTHITQEQVDAGKSLVEGYIQLREMHLKHNAFMNPITWGGGDSQELLDQLTYGGLLAEPVEWCFGRRWIDVKTMHVAKQLANCKPVQGGLARSMTKYGLTFQGTKHDALDDALNTFLLFRHLIGRISE